MKEFRTKEMSIKVRCACVSPEYFENNLCDYYEWIAYDFARSKVHGTYMKTIYKLKPSYSPAFSDIDEDFYCQLPPYVCKSIIY